MRPTQTLHIGMVGLVLTAWLCSAVCAESLEDAWSLALEQNQRLAAVKLEQAAASEDLGAAVAERMPSVSLRGAYTLQSEEPSFVIREPLPGLGAFEFPYAERNAASAGSEVRLPLYTGGRLKNSIASAAARHAASEWETAQARLDLLFAVGEAYLTVLRLQREVEVAQLEWESLTAHAADVVCREIQERASHGDVLAAQVAESAARQRHSQQQRALEAARRRYNQLLGRPLSEAVNVVEPHFESLPWDLDQLVQIACERRPDLKALVAVSDCHEFAASSVRGSRSPQVTASVGVQYQENRFATPDTLATAAVTVDWNLYNGGRTSRQADAEQARAMSVRCRIEDLKSQIAVDLLDAGNEGAEAAEQIQLAVQRVDHTTEDLRVTRLRFERGMALNAAVLDAQAQWAQALRDQQNARYQSDLAQLRIRYLAGLL